METAGLTQRPGVPSGRRQVFPTRGLRIAGQLAYWLWAVAAAMLCIALVNREPWMVALTSALAAGGLAAFDISRANRGGVSPMTVYALSACATELANVVGLLSVEGPSRSMYFLYAVDEHLLLASWLSLCGAVLPVLGFWAIARDPGWNRTLDILPKVVGQVRFQHLLVGGSLLAFGAIAMRSMRMLPNLGTLTALFLEMPLIVTFALARAGAERGRRDALAVGLAIALAESARALLFDFLRGNVIAPLVAFVLGTLLGSRSLRPLRSRYFVPVYGAAALFVTYFGAFGIARSGGSGVERVMRTIEMEEGVPWEMQGTSAQRQNVVGRLTNFNQLSQIGRLVNEDGFYDGETLEYLGVAFIPRFLWPEKPLIAKGSWFALRIGQAYTRTDGSPSNSVNMTVPGELYLNFGWLGVLLGAPLFGALIAVLWSRTDFWTDSRNTFGSAFGFFLFWFAVWLGVDLQVVVTLLAMYMLLVFGGAAYRAVFGEGEPARSVPVRSPMVGKAS